jgi:P4 family phage/plasmid primase-like protien
VVSAYGDAALSYLDAGWTCVLPVPADTKFPPPKGYSGNEGSDTDREAIERFRTEYPNHAILLRMPVGVIGLDIDHYDKEKTLKDGSTTIVKKRGGDDLVKYEKLWGPLPATWRSSARDLPSGIRFFRVPEGVKFTSGLGDIDTIQRHHRYAVAPPSEHALGPYVWTHPDVELTDEFPVPVVSELPMLPPAWVAGMTEHVNQNRAAVSSSAEATALLGAISLDPRPMCSLMEIACNRAVASLNAAGSGARHDIAMARTMRIIGLAAEGHTGGSVALARSRESWDTATEGEQRGYEWESLVAGAGAQAAGTIGASSPRPLDPCEGGSGLGIEIISSPTGKSNITLIVEGLDDARMCSEYAPDNAAVVGIAGRESWRKDGVPVAELRVVRDTGVVILASPDVSYDLESYNSALELGEACKGKGALEAAFSKPPGVAGARVSNYLASLEEAERAQALSYMLSAVTSKPSATKPKAARNSLGSSDPSDDLPPTNDTYLGTTWADEHLDEFRVVSDDKAWMNYRDGRWSQDGAELAVGHSLMEFVSEQAEAISTAAINARKTDVEKFEQLTRAYDAIMSSRKRQALQSTAMVYDRVRIRREDLDQHPNLWCAANRVIDLDTGLVYPQHPSMLLTVGSQVPYDPEVECPRFDRYLEETLPDPEVRAYVLRVFAMAMRGDVREQVFPVFIGGGRNGKGALIRIMRKVFCEMGVIVDPRSLLVTKFDKHEEEVARLRGKRLATAEEPKKGATWDSARIKAWTGGDHLTGSFKGRHSFDFAPSHTLIMTSNEKPNVDLGEDGSFWARYREIPFTVSFEGREDHEMEPWIVANELPGVLNRLLEAGEVYREKGLWEPHAVSGATLQTKSSSDHMAEFASDMIETCDPRHNTIPTAEMYQRYQKWIIENGVDQRPVPQARGLFNEALCKVLERDPKDPHVVGRVASRTRERVWFGLAWKTQDGIRPNEATPSWMTENLLTPKPTSTEGVRTTESENPVTESNICDNTLGRIDASVGRNERSTSEFRPKENPLVSEEFRTDRTDRTDKDGTGAVSEGNEEVTHDDLEEAVVDHDDTCSFPAVGSLRNGIPSYPSEPSCKAPCRGCQKMINAAGAERHDGLCGRCSS